MKFIINGKGYEAASLERVTGIDALELPRQAGMGLQTLARRVEEMARLAYTEDGAVEVLTPKQAATPEGAARIEGEAVLDSEPHLRALLAFLWLSRRASGERRLTFDEACDFPIASMEIVADDVEEAEPEPDPTRPGSGPVAAATA